MNQTHTFEQLEAAKRPINPINGSTYVDLSGQRWEFRNGTFVKSSSTRLSRQVKQ